MEIKLLNSEGKRLKTELPELRRGEGIDKLVISKRNKELIEEVLNSLRLENAQEKNVIDKYRTPLIVLAYVLNMDFDKATREDCKNLNSYINTSHYGWYRRENLRTAIRKAYRIWKSTGDQNPEIVWDLKAPKVDRNKPKPKKPRHLIKTNEEVDKIITELGNNRDKLYIALAWSTAGRCIELRLATWSQIYEEDGFVKINLNTAKKSGDEDDRVITLIYALPYYYRWKQEYKERFKIKNDNQLKDCYIFRKLDDGIRGRKSKKPKENIEYKNEPLSQGYYNKLFRNLRKKLDLPDFTPKIWRKFTISRWERSGIPHALIKKMSGHAKNSRAIEHYSYHDESDCSKYLLQMENIGKDIPQNKEPVPIIKCKRCDKESPSKDDKCQFCGFPLNEKEILCNPTGQSLEIEMLKQKLEEQKRLENERWEKLMELLKDKPEKLREIVKTTF